MAINSSTVTLNEVKGRSKRKIFAGAQNDIGFSVFDLFHLEADTFLLLLENVDLLEKAEQLLVVHDAAGFPLHQLEGALAGSPVQLSDMRFNSVKLKLEPKEFNLFQ
jgi:hypothetical protein